MTVSIPGVNTRNSNFFVLHYCMKAHLLLWCRHVFSMRRARRRENAELSARTTFDGITGIAS